MHAVSHFGRRSWPCDDAVSPLTKECSMSKIRMGFDGTDAEHSRHGVLRACNPRPPGTLYVYALDSHERYSPLWPEFRVPSVSLCRHYGNCVVLSSLLVMPRGVRARTRNAPFFGIKRQIRVRRSGWGGGGSGVRRGMPVRADELLLAFVEELIHLGTRSALGPSRHTS